MLIEEEIRSLFEQGAIPSDRHFDLLLPSDARSHSRLLWTPVSAAIEIARLLAPSPESRVLDVGSGCGKFVCIGALSTPGRFHGIENQRPLHQSALSLAKGLRLDRATFSCGDALTADWNPFSAIYLFNPMGENLWAADDGESPARLGYRRFAEQVARKLSSVSPGTRVATYHGFGAPFPESFRIVESFDIGKGPIEIWEQGSPSFHD